MVRVKDCLLAVAAAIGVAGGALALFSLATARAVERLLPPTGRFIAVGGARVHTLDVGPSDAAECGAPIVVIPGLGAQIRNFTYGVVEPLRRRHRVIVLDRPGAGYSRRSRGASATVSAQADIVAGLIRATGAGRPLVVGHSLGGAIALALALNHPECVGALALIAPLARPQDRLPEPFRGLAIRSPLLRWLAAWTIATPRAIAQSRQAIAFLFGPDPAPRDFPTRGGGLLSLRPSNFYAASTDLLQASDDLPGMVARYPTLALPVGILYGTGDRILDPVANGSALAGTIPDLDLELIEGGGHMLPITDPQRTVRFIERMAARLGQQGGMAA